MNRNQIAEMFRNFVKKTHLDQAGATAVEYGLMVALIAAVIVGTVATLGATTNNCFDGVASAMASKSADTGQCAN